MFTQNILGIPTWTAEENRIYKKVFDWVQANKRKPEDQKQQAADQFQTHFEVELGRQESRGILATMLVRCCMSTQAANQLIGLSAPPAACDSSSLRAEATLDPDAYDFDDDVPLLGGESATPYDIETTILKNFLDRFEPHKAGPEDQNWGAVLERTAMIGTACFAAMGGTYLKEVITLFDQPPINIQDFPSTSWQSILGKFTGYTGYTWLFTLFATSEPGWIKHEKKAMAIFLTSVCFLIGTATSAPSGIVAGKGFMENFHDITGLQAPEWAKQFYIAQSTNIASNALLAAKVLQMMISSLMFLWKVAGTASGGRLFWMALQILLIIGLSGLSNLAYVQSGTEVPGVSDVTWNPGKWLISAVLNIIQVTMTMLPCLVGSAATTWQLYDDGFARTMQIFIGVVGGLFDGTMTKLTFDALTGGSYSKTSLILSWAATISASLGFMQYGPDIANKLRAYWATYYWAGKQVFGALLGPVYWLYNQCCTPAGVGYQRLPASPTSDAVLPTHTNGNGGAMAAHGPVLTLDGSDLTKVVSEA